MKKLTNYEKDFQKKMKNPTFRTGFQEEYAKLAFAYQIAQFRKKQNISQTELAKRLKTTQSAIARMEAGEQNFTLDTLQKVADAFHRKLKIDLV